MGGRDAVQNSCLIREVQVSDIVTLRHKILRAGLPIETAIWPGDQDSGTLHFALYPAGDMSPVACVSFMYSPFDGEPAWRLRGMAVDDGNQGKGLGSWLLKGAERRLCANSAIRLFWCDARKDAVKFYEKHGWAIAGREFEIETAGPHYKMTKRLA